MGGGLQKRENQPSEEGGSWPWGVAFWGLTAGLAGLLRWRLGRRGTRLGWRKTRGGDSADFALWTFCTKRAGLAAWGEMSERCGLVAGEKGSARSLGGRGLGYRAFMQGWPLSPARTSGQPEGPAAAWAPVGSLADRWRHRQRLCCVPRLPSGSEEASAPAERAGRRRGRRDGGTRPACTGNGQHRSAVCAGLGAASGCSHLLLLLLWRVWEGRRADLTAMGIGRQM